MCFHVDSSLADKICLFLSATCTSQLLIAQRKMFPSLTFHHISLPVTGGHTGEKVAQGYRHPPRVFYHLNLPPVVVGSVCRRLSVPPDVLVFHPGTRA